MNPVSLSLAGNWQFRQADDSNWLPATVPGCVHTDLLANSRIPDPFWGNNEQDLQWIETVDWEYQRTIDVPAELLAHECVELVADGLDTLATVSINGLVVATTDNMFRQYRVPVKDALQPGANVIMVAFANPLDYIQSVRQEHDFKEWNDPVSGSSRIRKEPCSFGWDWGPRFATCGIWRDLRVEAWSGPRLANVLIEQDHRADGSVVLHVTPELCGDAAANSAWHCRLELDGAVVAESDGLALTVAEPCLWWPNGHGEQPLYTLTVALRAGGAAVVSTSRRIGLRTIVLDRHPDQWGECFQFVVNGRPIFAKGANWIPNHSFVATLGRDDYTDVLTSAAAANMNMLRVWGGGIFEHDGFYEQCDELGLLLWHDFMFACSLYPGDDAFLASVDAEVRYQIPRLRHHACIALWCGSNEIEWIAAKLEADSRQEKAFNDLFYGVLPQAVTDCDPTRTYWPSSPHHPHGPKTTEGPETGGDAHYWAVWHGRQPVKAYEGTAYRFVSEFGMQSYSSPEVAATYAPEDEWNVFGPAMENHQKNAAGNLIILDYASRRYRFPNSYASLAYQSQLNQAYCMKVAVEHFRRSMPQTMGAIYWQLNDCWPVFSWSSLEFGGKWKALHHAARRFFAPALISAHVPGDEKIVTMNRVVSEIHDVKVWTVYDGLGEFTGAAAWTLYHLDRGIIDEGARTVTLRYGEATIQHDLDFAAALAEHGHRKLFLRIRLDDQDGNTVAQDTVFFTAPRFLDLRPETLEPEFAPGVGDDVVVTITAAEFHHQLQLTLPGARFSDNFIDLYPGIAREVVITPPAGMTFAQVCEKLELMSLVDSYR